ncbi:MAG TPA: hypothetical protein VI338_00095 [Nitrososphaera sp.]|nr:hypothetical protein [Nitrososphaera sp.]
MDNLHSVIGKLIVECKNELDVDSRAQILHQINTILPRSQKIKIPSLITNDYISAALYKIEENLLVAV